MKRIVQLALTLLTLTLLPACSGLMSEAEKSEVNKAPSEITIDGHHLQFTATLTKQPTGKGDAFDLHGTIVVSAQGESLPANLAVSSFTLKPSWKGWPGYYVVDFYNRGGQWYRPSANMYQPADKYFAGNSTFANGTCTIQFTWLNQGHGAGTKPEHFTAYDVSAVLTDAAKKSYRMAHLNVPATGAAAP